ncbi:cytochrome c oxidase assembly factor Coa1 family protein [Flavobacterium saccharophilum]|uniref:Cytochrome oxidase complex assembly protein 1 n=1 Tax=Flavobacterium saccharophilum TaxID=29534 RepID=A0A1M6Z7R4_9FLAO|nr:cytochrome c oxidase assembly factor Coa1 family protein [Flavobacterium saccharophilum]SHL26485.1 Cytochrome oxidase complex assembly protein 1 [Flavobacterium saccharophilum]
MENELVEKESWLKRNWKWSIPTTILIISIFGFFLTSNSPEGISDIVQAYNDNLLYEKAIERANSDKRIVQSIGIIQPIDKLALLEGNAVYSNNNNSVSLSFRIKGTKGNGKLDISADKIGTVWKYKQIILRNKDSKEEIFVLKEF